MIGIIRKLKMWIMTEVKLLEAITLVMNPNSLKLALSSEYRSLNWN